MKIGQLVKHESGNSIIRGVVIGLDPSGDGCHTEIFWADPEEPGGWIVSTWENIDFEVIG